MDKTCLKAFLVHQDQFFVVIPVFILPELVKVSHTGKGSFPPYPV